VDLVFEVQAWICRFYGLLPAGLDDAAAVQLYNALCDLVDQVDAH
jgi:hypothetical protein